MSDDLTIGERITHCQEKYHMTPDDLAKRLEISKNTLNGYKKDPDKIPIGVFRRMCKLFNCKTEYLMDGTDTAAEYENAVRLIRASFK